MPTTHAKLDYQFALRRVIKWLGAGDDNYPEGTTVNANSLYTQTMIRQQIIQSDLEVAALAAASPDNPYRNEYFTDDPVTVADGEKIVGYVGVHGNAQVRDPEGVQEDVWPAKLATSFDHIERIRDKAAIGATLVPESSLLVYFIHNGIVHLANRAYVLEIELPKLPFDLADETPALLSPQLYANAVIAHAVFTSLPLGADNGHRTQWSNIWAAYAQMIAGGAFSLPEPERLERVAS